MLGPAPGASGRRFGPFPPPVPSVPSGPGPAALAERGRAGTVAAGGGEEEEGLSVSVPGIRSSRVPGASCGVRPGPGARFCSVRRHGAGARSSSPRQLPGRAAALSAAAPG